VTSIEFHSAFGFGDGPIHVFDGTHAPAALVMLGASELGPRGAKMLERRMHVWLIGAYRTETHSCHDGENDDN
jgi:hypothetical protein